MTIFKILLGDITKLKFDAIVNAANTSLLGGGGVDGAIHKACGDKLLQECRELKGCFTGNSKITRSYNLSKLGIYWIIHTVGPIYRANGSEEKYLRSAYNSALTIAANYAESYKNQINEFFTNNPYRFDTGGFMRNRKKEHAIKELNDYTKNHPIKTIAFPSISTGAYSYPLEEAAKIALDEIFKFMDEFPDALDEINMVCIDKRTYETYKNLYNEKFL